MFDPLPVSFYRKLNLEKSSCLYRITHFINVGAKVIGLSHRIPFKRTVEGKRNACCTLYSGFSSIHSLNYPNYPTRQEILFPFTDDKTETLSVMKHNPKSHRYLSPGSE